MTVRILAFSGSARRDSLNRKLLAVAVAAARAAGGAVTELDLRALDLPIYDGDLEAAGPPPSVLKLRDAFRAHDALLIATPEYNGGVPPLLKNALDWASRPLGGEPNLALLKGKTAAIVSAVGGIVGGARVQQHLRQTFQVMGVVTVPETVHISLAPNAFAADGTLKDKAVEGLVALAARRLVEIASRLSP
jgi:chromate reductase, NAD(P)H dehydrogenase (quinone)